MVNGRLEIEIEIEIGIEIEFTLMQGDPVGLSPR